MKTPTWLSSLTRTTSLQLTHTTSLQLTRTTPIQLTRTTLIVLTQFVLIQALLTQPVFAQSPITAITATYQTQLSSLSLYIAPPVGAGAFGGCTTSSFTYTFSIGLSNQYKLNSFNAGGSTYFVAPAGSATIRLRRVNNAN